MSIQRLLDGGGYNIGCTDDLDDDVIQTYRDYNELLTWAKAARKAIAECQDHGYGFRDWQAFDQVLRTGYWVLRRRILVEKRSPTDEEIWVLKWAKENKPEFTLCVLEPDGSITHFTIDDVPGYSEGETK